MDVSRSAQDYLKAIHSLGGAETTVSPVDIAARLEVRAPSVTGMLKRLAEDSRKDDGNVRYDVFQQTAPRTNHFTIFGTWKDRNAFDAHEAKAHTRQFRETAGPMLGAPYDERLYSPLN